MKENNLVDAVQEVYAESEKSFTAVVMYGLAAISVVGGISLTLDMEGSEKWYTLAYYVGVAIGLVWMGKIVSYLKQIANK